MKLYHYRLMNQVAGASVFLKNSNYDLDPKNLKCKLARDFVIPNISVKLYQNWSTNKVNRVMTKGKYTYVSTNVRIKETLYALHNIVVRGDYKIYIMVKGRETFNGDHKVLITSCSEVQYVL